MRLKILRVMLVILFFGIGAGLTYVQAIQGAYYSNLSKNNRIRVVPLDAWRGRVLDRNGVVLADNKRSYNILVTPQLIKHADKLFAFLSKTLDIDESVLQRNYKRRKFTPFAPVTVAGNVSREAAIAVEEVKFLYPSLYVQEAYQRYYPLGTNGAHILGYIGKVNASRLKEAKEYGYTPQAYTGYSGVEEFYDAYLRGVSGGLQIEVNSRGEQVRLLSLKEPRPGQDIELTIDSRIQKMAQDALDGRPGVIIIMDRTNGELLTLASSPSYDPNFFYNAPEKIQELYRQPSAPFLNRAIRGLYPPGSVFKIPVAIAGLDTGKVNENTTFDCEGEMVLGGIRFGCTHTHGPQNIVQSIAHSCNVYYYQLGLILKDEILHQYALRFGLGRRTHVDLPHEKKGLIPNRKIRTRQGGQWHGGDNLNFAIGQGDVLVTPLQLVNMMATVANSGKEVHPHVIRKVGGETVESFNETRTLEISKRHFDTVQRGMEAVVQSYTGTAHMLNIEGMKIAGKTGTAQSSGDQEHHSWFVGSLDSGDHQWAFCVFLEHGGSSKNAVMLARDYLLNLRSSGHL